MTSPERIALMQQRLSAALSPTLLTIDDESHLHRGHAGAVGGAGHYALKISAAAFANKTSVESHKLIYAALGDLMGKEIHALKIKVIL